MRVRMVAFHCTRVRAWRGVGVAPAGAMVGVLLGFVALSSVGCPGDTVLASLDGVDESAAEGGADFEAGADDAASNDAFDVLDAGAQDEDSFEDGEHVEGDAAVDEWPPLPPGCLDWGVFPAGSVGCMTHSPRCPEEFSYCCSTSQCGSLEFGATGCCGSPDCGDPSNYHCVEVIGDSTPQVCTRPEPEFRCPGERPFCCFNFMGAAVCADHELLRWTSCEDQSATGGGS